MRDLNEIFIFTQVVKAGSFSRAAQALGLPKSTVSRKVSSLEERLGIALLQRTTRKLKLTDVGAEYFRNCSRGILEIEEAESHATQEQSEPQGLVRVTAPVELGASLLPGVIHDFLKQYPKVEAELIITDRMVDLIGEGVDVAIRAGKLTDSGLIARKIGEEAFQLVAAPSYLKKNPVPAHPKELDPRELLVFSPEGAQMMLYSERGKFLLKMSGSVRSDSMTMLRALAVAGHGIALLPSSNCGEELKSGRLVRVFPEWSSERFPFYAVYAARRHMPPKLKAFLECLTREFKQL